jgi:hypothetical protein
MLLLVRQEFVLKFVSGIEVDFGVVKLPWSLFRLNLTGSSAYIDGAVTGWALLK